MSDSQKDLQRRELIFRILDDLKEKGERINADKLARMAQMGKQTVLPHYNEWRFLDDSEKEIDTELPADLVRVLKRGLVQWRHEATENQREFEENANQEIDQLQQLASKLTDDLETIKQSLISEQEEKTSLIKELEKEKAENAETRSQLVELNARYEAAKETLETNNQQVEQLKKDHADALASQEKQLDNQYQGQLNHWMKIVDNERRLRADTDKKLDSQKEQALKIEKERNDLQLRLESKSRAHLDACEERNQFKQALKESEKNIQIVQELSLLLDAEPEQLKSASREMLSSHQSLQLCQRELAETQTKASRLEEELTKAQGKLESATQLERDLEKQKGYCEALEMAMKNLREASS